MINLGIGRDMMKVRDPVRLAGIAAEGTLREYDALVFELFFDVFTGWQREAAIEIRICGIAS